MINDTLKIAKYRFTLEAIDTIILPAYKGSTFHGGFGHALKKISPIWFRYFYQAGKNGAQDWPKPFVILPPLDEQEKYPKGHQFHCELTLFGEATQHFAICQAAIEYLGLHMGIGSKKGRYKVNNITRAQVLQQPANTIATTPAEIITARNPGLSDNTLSLLFLSRLHVKSHNTISQQAPSFQLLFNRLCGRIKTLGKAYGLDPVTPRDEQQELIQQAKEVAIKQHNLHWDSWKRFSGRQQRTMPFGGLRGSITYTGELGPYLPYFCVGEWTQIGSKTSFGFGKYIILNP